MCKNRPQLRKIYVAIAYKLRKVSINSVILNQPKFLNRAKPKIHKDPSAKTQEEHLRRLTNDCEKNKYKFYEISYIKNAQNVRNGCVTQPLGCSWLKEEQELILKGKKLLEKFSGGKKYCHFIFLEL